MKKLHYHEDVHKLHVNTLPPRAYFVPHSAKRSAMEGDRTKSDRFMSGIRRFSEFLVDAARQAPQNVQFEKDKPSRPTKRTSARTSAKVSSKR